MGSEQPPHGGASPHKPELKELRDRETHFFRRALFGAEPTSFQASGGPPMHGPDQNGAKTYAKECSVAKPPSAFKKLAVRSR